MKQTFKFLTLSRVLNDCRDSVGRLSTLFLLLFALSFGFSSQAWADNGDFYNVYLKWTYSGTDKAQDLGTSGFAEQKLGTLTSNFNITGAYLKCWDDFGENSYESSGGQMCYKIGSSGAVQYWTGFTRTSKSGNNYEYQKTGTLTIGDVEGASGKYTAELWFQTWGWGDRYINNGGGNYKFSYTILPPAVDLSITPSGNLSGSGTEADPYIVFPGNSLTLTASATPKHSDANSSVYYTINNNESTSTKVQTISNITAKGSCTIKARSKNTNESLNSGYDEKTIYYAPATFYLMQTTNKESKGSSVGTMSSDGNGNYTCDWTCSTPGTYKFYVTTNTSSSVHKNCDFLSADKSFTNGNPVQLYLYGNTFDAQNKYDDAITLTTTYAGTYTFTFYKDSNNKYQFKCDYPAAYSSLSAVRTPEAAADAPQISNTIVAQGSSVTVTAKTPKTGYKFDGWTSDKGSFGTNTDLSTSFTPNANNAVAIANYSLINYAITYAENSDIASYTAKPETSNYGNTITVTATATANHVITGASTNVTGVTPTFTSGQNTQMATVTFTMPASDVQLTWVTALGKVNLNFNAGANGSLGAKIGENAQTTGTQIDGGSVVNFTATPDSYYEVEGWYSDSEFNNKITDAGTNNTYSVTANADVNVYVKFKETLHSVNIISGTGIQSVMPAGDTKIGNVTPVSISATVTTGYTWSQWTASSVNVTITDATLASTTIKATGTGTVTATATEKTVTLTPTVNDNNMGTVSAAGTVGIATGLTLTATKKNGYKFDHWVLSGNLAIQDSKTVNDNPITVKTNGDGNAVSAQAVFVEDLSSDIYVEGGNPPFGGWTTDAANEMLKATGHSTSNDIYYHFTTTNVDQEAEFKLFDKNNTPGWLASSGYWWYSYCTEQTFDYGESLTNMKFIGTVIGDYVFHYNTNTKKFDITYPDVYCLMGAFNSWSSTTHPFNTTSNQVSIDLAENTEYAFRVVYQGKYFRVDGKMTSGSCTNWNLYNNGDNKLDVKIQTTIAGTYTFTFDPTNKQLSISYPGETKTVVTIDNGETVENKEVAEVSPTAISAPQYLNGKRFKEWEVTGGTITIADKYAYSTTINGPSNTGITVKATYTTENMIYFRNVPGWDNVYVFFYKQSYYNATSGTGAYCKDNNQNLYQVAVGKPMIRLNAKSDIWYCDYSDVDNTFKTTIIAFNDHFETNNEYFDACQAAYRSDWHKEYGLSVYVPEKNYKEKKNNNVPYFNNGYWMKYDDLNSGYYLRVQGKSTEGSNYEFKASQSGNSYTTTIILEGSQTKEFWINGSNGSTYKNNGTMTSNGSHTGWDFYEGVSNNCKITTTSEGTYTFTLTFGDGILYVSVEYPLSEGDYRVVYTDNSHPCHPSTFIRKGNGNKDTVSFFIDKGKNPALKFQYCSNISGSTVTWTDVDGGTISLEGITETGIYNFYLNQTESSISCASHALYTGNFYIRTAIADGGWDAYKGAEDNLLPYIEYGLDDSQPFKFTHAYTNWVEKDKNVKFCIANDYSLCISDTLVGDKIIGTGDNADWLKNGANIRFMWNKNTNELKRAYISGSTNDEERFLMLENTNDKMYNKEGNEQIDELKFIDKNNWVYQADIKAQPGCEVKLTAQYTIGSEKHVQYFMGSESTTRTIISGNATNKQYTMRVVYDFKTNRLTAGWVPDGQEITDNIKLGGDMLITRTHQDDAQQIFFGTGGSIEDIKHIYGVLTIKKEQMLSATNANYGKTMYWISFPFDVKISEIFGVDGYGTKWIMQKYRGDLRAQKGWFKQDTETFWEFMDESETLKAYEGYLFLIDANYFNTDGADVWKNSATEANFYFPSASGNIGIINKSSYPQYVQPHECKIDREFEVTDSKGNKTTVNHKNTDSHWNVIGVPAFQNKTMALGTETETDMKAIYQWNSTNNTYDVKALSTNFEFKTMYAYMVQYTGTINWSDVSVVNNPTEAQGGTAPKYAYADEKNYMIELFFNGNGAEDHTYINLADEASTDFVLNEDMMKIDNAGFPNIYSFAGNYNVAYNETKKDNQTVMLGVSAPKDGNYTFAMPKDFSGTAKLVDLVEGITTDLNVANYSVDLNKGTYNNRFQLVLEVEAKTPTSIEADGQRGREADGKTTKILRNGEIYLINGGRVYNVLGVEE